MMIEIDLSELDQRVDTLEADVHAGLAVAVADACDAGVKAAKTNAPRRGGDLADSIHANQATGTGGVVVLGEIIADTAYAKMVADGTKRHEIAASGKALAFPFAGSAVFFRKRVMHPGTKPNDFMRMGEAAAKSELGSSMVQEVEKAAAKFNG